MIGENVLANGIGSTQFQIEIEDFLLKSFSASNLQVVTDLIKGLSSYQVKTPELEELLEKTILLHKDDFTVK